MATDRRCDSRKWPAQWSCGWGGDAVSSGSNRRETEISMVATIMPHYSRSQPVAMTFWTWASAISTWRVTPRKSMGWLLRQQGMHVNRHGCMCWGHGVTNLPFHSLLRQVFLLWATCWWKPPCSVMGVQPKATGWPTWKVKGRQLWQPGE